jgi:hypothetical protein
VRLLVKNLGRHILEDVVREELENLRLVSRESYSSARAGVNKNLPKSAPNPALYCFGSAGTGSGETTFPDRTLRFTILGGNYIAPKGPM